MSDNGKKIASASGLATPWQPGQSGNPSGVSRKQVLRDAFNHSLTQKVTVRDQDGNTKQITRAEFIVDYLYKHGFPKDPDVKLLPFTMKCLDEVLSRVDPIDVAEAGGGVQIVVNSQSQAQFWQGVMDSSDGQRLAPVDVLNALEGGGNGKQPD